MQNGNPENIIDKNKVEKMPARKLMFKVKFVSKRIGLMENFDQTHNFLSTQQLNYTSSLVLQG